MQTRDIRRKLDVGRATAVRAFIVGMMLVSGLQAGAMPMQRDHGVTASAKGTSFALDNGVIGAHWSLADGRLSRVVITDRLHGTEVRVEDAFRILLADGAVLSGQNLNLVGTAKVVRVAPDAQSPKAADAIAGRAVEARFENADKSIDVDWSVVLFSSTAHLRRAPLSSRPVDSPRGPTEVTPWLNVLPVA